MAPGWSRGGGPTVPVARDTGGSQDTTLSATVGESPTNWVVSPISTGPVCLARAGSAPQWPGSAQNGEEGQVQTRRHGCLFCAPSAGQSPTAVAQGAMCPATPGASITKEKG